MKNFLILALLLVSAITANAQENSNTYEILKNDPKTKLTPLSVKDETLTLEHTTPNTLHLFIGPNIQKTIITDGNTIVLKEITYAAKIETPLPIDHPLYEKYNGFDNLYIIDKEFKIKMVSKKNSIQTVQSFTFDKKTRKGEVILQNGQKIKVQHDSPFITYNSDEVILNVDML